MTAEDVFDVLKIVKSERWAEFTDYIVDNYEVDRDSTTRIEALSKRPDHELIHKELLRLKLEVC